MGKTPPRKPAGRPATALVPVSYHSHGSLPPRRIVPPVRYLQAVGASGTFPSTAASVTTIRSQQMMASASSSRNPVGILRSAGAGADLRLCKNEPLDIDPFAPEDQQVDVGANEDVYDEDIQVYEEPVPAFDPEEVGLHLLENDSSLQSNEQIRAFVESMTLGPINLRGMMDLCQSAQTQVERSIRLTLLGLAAKISSVSSAQAKAATTGASNVSGEERNRSTSSPPDEKDPSMKKWVRRDGTESGERRLASNYLFLDMCTEDPVVTSMESKKSRLFISGVRFYGVLCHIQKRMCQRFTGHLRQTKSQQQWETFIQGLYFAMLREKDHIKRLTFRSKGEGELFNVNTIGTDDETNTERVIEFVLRLIGKKGLVDESDWIGCVMDLVMESLKKARRLTAEDMKRRANEPHRSLDYYRRLLGDELTYEGSDFDDDDENVPDEYKQLQVI